MVERHDYVALDWVKGEIQETLVQSRQALEAYVENPEDSSRLRFCLAYLHQISGTLHMVEFYGAALLAEEMEKLAAELVNEAIPASEDNLSVLMQAILQLPVYLDHIKSSKRDLPLILLPLLNDLRSARGEALMSETALFTPNLTAVMEAPVDNDTGRFSDPRLLDLLRKLRQMFQYALVGILNGKELAHNFEYCLKVFSRLETLAGNTPKGHLWKVGHAYLQGLAEGTIELSTATKRLLKFLDHSLKDVCVNKAEAINARVDEEVLKNLLYYIAKSDSQNNMLTVIKERFDLGNSLPISASDENDPLSGPDHETMNSVVSALMEELGTIKDALDIMVRGKVQNSAKLLELVPDIKHVADTMAVLALGIPRKVLLEQIDIINSLHNANEPLSDGSLMDIAGALIYVEATLSALSTASGHDVDGVQAAHSIDGAQEAVIREARNGLEQVKEAITDYIGSQFDANSLESIPSVLSAICGGLRMIPMLRPAGILASCLAYVKDKLTDRGYRPEWTELDTLADAIMGVEYYLERLGLDGPQGNQHLLAEAEKRVADLGYAVIKPVELPVAELEADNEEDSVLQFDVTTDDSDIASDAETAGEPDEEETVAAELVTGDAATAESDDDLIDDEIIEVFLEEVEEVQEALNEYFPRYVRNSEDKEALTEFRRAFHTLKGSGRMVGANVIGELAWSIENMLNRLIDGTIGYSQPLVDVVQEVIDILPNLVEAFRTNGGYDQDRVDYLSNKATAIATNSWSETPFESDLPFELEEADQDTDEDEDEELTGSGPEPELEFETAEQQNPLLDVFRTELDSLLAVLEEEVNLFRQNGQEELLKDKIQRALHTIKGSAHMATLHTIADLVQPVEKMIKEFQEWRIRYDSAINDCLSELITRVRITLACEEADDPIPEDNVEFVQRVKQLHESKLSTFKRNTGAPEEQDVMAIFMSESMDIILDAERIVSDWKEAEISSDQLQVLIQELKTLAGAARTIDLKPVVTLSDALAELYTVVQQQRIATDDEFFVAALAGQDALINMMDRIAAGQSVWPQEEVERMLRSLITGTDTQTASELPLPELDVVEFDEDTAGTDIEELITLDNVADDLSGDGLEETEGDFELIGIFLEEANDLLEDITQTFDQWADDIDNTDLIEALQRDLHTLKGGARMAELKHIGDLGHELEFLYEDLCDGKYPVSTQITNLCRQCHERLADMVHDVESTMSCRPAKELIEAIQQFRSNALDQKFGTVAQEPEAVFEEDEIDSDFEPSEPEGASEPVETEPSQPNVSFVGASSAKRDDQGIDWQMTLTDDMDLDILDIFVDEANELLLELDGAIHGWQADPEDENHTDELKRVLHTLKGGARLAKLTILGNKAHEFETFVISAQRNHLPLDESFFGQILAMNDQLVNGVETLQQMLAQQGLSGAVGPSVIAQVEDEDEPEEPYGSDLAAQIAPQSEQPATNVVPFQKREVEKRDDDKSKGRNKGGQPQETVKVGASLLENLVNLAGETSIARSRLEEQVSDFGFTLEEMEGTIDRLRDQVRRLDIETDAQVSFRQERAEESNYQDFDPLEMDRYSVIQQLSRSLMESASDLLDLKNSLTDKTRDAETLLLQQSRINTELQEGLMQTRMVPFSRLIPRLRRIVRQIAGELGKEVELVVNNAEGELDRTVLERMISPLEHMLRNAVDHGIELPERRQELHKRPVGQISIFINREGSDAVIRIKDDGAGINVGKVREKAVERGLISKDQQLSDQDVLQFILDSGFSTAAKVTQISGRGVGMDVVHSEVKALGGQMVIDTQLNQGTEFTIHLPVSVSVNRALMVAIGDDHYAIPLDTIEGIVRIAPQQLMEYVKPGAVPFEYAGNRYKVNYLGSTLNYDHRPSFYSSNMPVPLVLVKRGTHSESIALNVDKLMGSREIVVKSLGPQFADVQALSGATILGDGSVVVILDLTSLLRSDLTISRTGTDDIGIPVLEADYERDDEFGEPVEVEATNISTGHSGRRASGPATIMVVDDSVTVRKVTSRLLERQGYEVLVAKDGVDAVALLQDRVPDCILLDIEMPRMDGFDVANRVRHDSRTKQVPIIMITSRTGSKHKDRALAIGVNDYMGKPFQESMLLEAIEKLVKANRVG
ncbi:Hpt domain-containing protein [Gynuella sp.]|uniref:hybrid sensor histidine kinase/response regulator n=1 Tax=Gynuella sp. TaxID=2969146 RepID=UPI003D0C068E